MHRPGQSMPPPLCPPRPARPPRTSGTRRSSAPTSQSMSCPLAVQPAMRVPVALRSHFTKPPLSTAPSTRSKFAWAPQMGWWGGEGRQLVVSAWRSGSGRVICVHGMPLMAPPSAASASQHVLLWPVGTPPPPPAHATPATPRRTSQSLLPAAVSQSRALPACGVGSGRVGSGRSSEGGGGGGRGGGGTGLREGGSAD